MWPDDLLCTQYGNDDVDDADDVYDDADIFMQSKIQATRKCVLMDLRPVSLLREVPRVYRKACPG